MRDAAYVLHAACCGQCSLCPSRRPSSVAPSRSLTLSLSTPLAAPHCSVRFYTHVVCRIDLLERLRHLPQMHVDGSADELPAQAQAQVRVHIDVYEMHGRDVCAFQVSDPPLVNPHPSTGLRQSSAQELPAVVRRNVSDRAGNGTSLVMTRVSCSS